MDLVTFGKYKGKPIAEMLADTNYMNWLNSQPWWKDHKCYVIVMQQTPNKDQPTPEHNKLQLKFLDDDFCFRFLKLFQPDFLEEAGGYCRKTFEPKGFDVLLNFTVDSKTKDYCLDDSFLIEIKTQLGDDYPCVLRKIKEMKERYYHPMSNGYVMDIGYDLKIVLLIDKFESEVTTREQLVSFFKNEGIQVIFFDQLQ